MTEINRNPALFLCVIVLISLNNFADCLETLARFTEGLEGISFRHPETGGKCLTLEGLGSPFVLENCEYSEAGDLSNLQALSSLSGCTVDSNKFSAGNDSVKFCLALETGIPSRSLLGTASCEDKAWDRLSFRRLSIPGDDFRHLIQNIGTKRCLRSTDQRIDPSFRPISSAPCDPKDGEQHFVTCAATDKQCGMWQLV